MKKKLFVFAAALALLSALALGVFASYRANIFGLQQLMIGGRLDADGAISLAGIQNSPEYTAAREWLEFIAAYDPDGALFEQASNNPAELDPKYGLYLVFTQEMADKLDEITEKYGLNLHSSLEALPSEALLNSRLNGVVLPAAYELLGGYIYENNSFAFDGYAYLENGTGLSFQFMNARKGTFSDVMLHIGDAARYETWGFSAPGGMPLLLALGPAKSLVIADTGRSFVTINVLSGSGESDDTQFLEGADFITQADLELFARGINFDLLR